jgi:hypothetical protein
MAQTLPTNRISDADEAYESETLLWNQRFERDWSTKHAAYGAPRSAPLPDRQGDAFDFSSKPASSWSLGDWLQGLDEAANAADMRLGQPSTRGGPRPAPLPAKPPADLVEVVRAVRRLKDPWKLGAINARDLIEQVPASAPAAAPTLAPASAGQRPGPAGLATDLPASPTPASSTIVDRQAVDETPELLSHDAYVAELEEDLALADETINGIAVALTVGSRTLDAPTLLALIAETKIRRGRGRPKIEGERPWELAGMSRASWYRKQKAD